MPGHLGVKGANADQVEHAGVEYIAILTAMRDLLPLQDMLKTVTDKLKLTAKSESEIKLRVFQEKNNCIGLASSNKLHLEQNTRR